MTGRTYTVEEPATAMDGIASAQTSANDNEVSLIEVLTQLALRKSLIVKITGVSILAGIVLSLLLPVRYTAVTKIMPPQQTQSTASMMMMSQLTGLGGSSLAAMAGGGLGLKNPNDIYIGLLNSRPIADSVIGKFGMMGVYHAKDMTQARLKLADYTSITSEKSGLVAISVTDRDKKRAAAMANEYTDQLRALTKTLAITEASQRRLFYEDQLKQTKDALVNAAVAFEQVQQKRGLVQPDAQAKAMIEGLAQIRAQITAKEVQVQALRSYSTDRNPEVEIAERELSSLRSEEAQMEQNSHEPGIAGLGLGNVPSAGLEYLRAEHELQYEQALYDILMKQYDAARLDESKDAAIIQVVEPAIEPDRKSSPKRAIIAILFAIGGFFVACIAAMFNWWREIVRADPEQEEKIEALKNAFRTRKAETA